MKKALLPLLLVVSALGCGSNPVSFSEPVTITLPTVQSKFISSGGPISVSKDISTGGANPYSAFINDAVKQLGGKDPSRIVVTSLTLQLLNTSTGVTALEQVFSGAVTISFQMNGSGTIYPVGAITGPSGAGPVGLAVAFDSNSMVPADYAALLQNQFKIVLAGTAATGFNSTVTETADTEATFGFVAYE